MNLTLISKKKKPKKLFDYLRYRVETYDLNQTSTSSKIFNMNPNDNLRTFKEIIKEKQIRQGKNGKDYLLLRLENSETIFVFHNKDVPSNRWTELTEGSEYTFTVKEGLNGSNVLVEFEPELGIFN